MPFWNLFLLSGIVILTSMILLWLLSLALKNSSIIDIFWGIAFVIVTWLAFSLGGGYIPRKQLVAVLVTMWGLRLALHIFFRNWGKGEDFRYAKWREENGPRWWWFSLFQVFLLQGVLIWLISAPLLAAETSGFPVIMTPLDMIGVVVWMFGFLFEMISDLQLMSFKQNPKNKGKLFTKGLWKFTRHPNYFGETVLWWGYYIIALASGSWWTIFSPIIMTYLLVKVSGIAMLEQTMKLKPGYEEYMRKTSAFIPWLPKS